MAAPLLQINDPQGLRLVTIDKPVYTIGRRSTADLQVAGADVSRDHAEILQSGESYRVHDKGSRYGTFVNGEEVIERELNHGDRIRLGKSDAVELVFLTGGKETSGLREATSGAADLRQMAGLLDGLRALGSGRVLDEVLTLVMDSALDVTPADRGFLMLANREGGLRIQDRAGQGRITLLARRSRRAPRFRGGLPHRPEPHRRRPHGRRICRISTGARSNWASAAVLCVPFASCATTRHRTEPREPGDRRPLPRRS
jgi:hypothetical protein